MNWWHDPLQSLFISSLLCSGMAVGSALRRPSFNSAAFWTSGMFVSSAVGLLIGQMLVYRIYRQRITARFREIRSRYELFRLCDQRGLRLEGCSEREVRGFLEVSSMPQSAGRVPQWPGSFRFL
jgi:hypothetical protein